MNGVRKYLVIILLSLFAAGTMAGAAMAHCGHAMDGGNASMMKDGSGASAGKMSMEEHGCHDMDAQAEDHSSDSSSDCNNCKGSVCQSPSLAPALTELSHLDSTAPLHSEEFIRLYTISRSIIPDPPQQLS